MTFYGGRHPFEQFCALDESRGRLGITDTTGHLREPRRLFPQKLRIEQRRVGAHCVFQSR